MPGFQIPREAFERQAQQAQGGFANAMNQLADAQMRQEDARRREREFFRAWQLADVGGARPEPPQPRPVPPQPRPMPPPDQPVRGQGIDPPVHGNRAQWAVVDDRIVRADAHIPHGAVPQGDMPRDDPEWPGAWPEIRMEKRNVKNFLKPGNEGVIELLTRIDALGSSNRRLRSANKEYREEIRMLKGQLKRTIAALEQLI